MQHLLRALNSMEALEFQGWLVGELKVPVTGRYEFRHKLLPAIVHEPAKSTLSRTCRYEIRCSHLHTIYIDEAVYHADIYDSGQVRKIHRIKFSRERSPNLFADNFCRHGCH